MIQLTMECCLVMQLADDANSECCTTCSDQAAVAILNPDSLVSRAAVADATHLQLAMWFHDANSECCTFRSAQQTLLHTDPFTHKPFYTQTILHTDAFTYKSFYNLLHTDPFSHKIAFTHTRERVARRPPKSQFHLSFWHSTIISCERVARKLAKSQFYYTFGHQNVWIRAVGRQCHVVIQKVPFYRSFRRSKLVLCERVAAEGVKSQFHCSFWRSKLVSCERVAAEVVIAILLQFLAIEARFVRKGCCRGCNIAILLQFLAIEPHFVRKGCRRGCNIAILLQFLAIQPCFVRKGFAFRAVSLALPRALREK